MKKVIILLVSVFAFLGLANTTASAQYGGYKGEKDYTKFCYNLPFGYSSEGYDFCTPNVLKAPKDRPIPKIGKLKKMFYEAYYNSVKHLNLSKSQVKETIEILNISNFEWYQLGEIRFDIIYRDGGIQGKYLGKIRVKLFYDKYYNLKYYKVPNFPVYTFPYDIKENEENIVRLFARFDESQEE